MLYINVSRQEKHKPFERAPLPVQIKKEKKKTTKPKQLKLRSKSVNTYIIAIKKWFHIWHNSSCTDNEIAAINFSIS